jgi:hypothetical protein
MSGWLLLALGVLLVLGYVKGLHDTPTAKDLVAIDGVPENVSVSQVTGRRGDIHLYLHFTVNGNEFVYGDQERPRYEEIVATVKARQPVKAWTANRWLLFGNERELWKLETAQGVVLPFAVSSGQQQKDQAFLLLGIVVCLGAGVAQLFLNFRKARVYKEWAKANPDKVAIEKPSVPQCPNCKAKVTVPPEYLGQRVVCPSCKHVYVAPIEDENTPPRT